MQTIDIQIYTHILKMFPIGLQILKSKECWILLFTSRMYKTIKWNEGVASLLI